MAPGCSRYKQSRDVSGSVNSRSFVDVAAKIAGKEAPILCGDWFSQLSFVRGWIVRGGTTQGRSGARLFPVQSTVVCSWVEVLFADGDSGGGIAPPGRCRARLFSVVAGMSFVRGWSVRGGIPLGRSRARLFSSVNYSLFVDGALGRRGREVYPQGVPEFNDDWNLGRAPALGQPHLKVATIVNFWHISSRAAPGSLERDPRPRESRLFI